MNRSAYRGNATTAQRADMVGVHFEAYTIKPARIDALVARHGPHGFGEHDRRAAMQQTVGLVGAGVDDHACGEGVIVYRFETNIEQTEDGVLAVCVELFEFGGTLPNAQVSLSLISDFYWWLGASRTLRFSDFFNQSAR